MGSFSFTRADLCTRRSNFIEGDKYKMLIPKEFGGGYILDMYFDYGKVFDEPEWGAKYVDAEGNEHLATHLGFRTGDYVPPANNNGIITGTIHNAKYADIYGILAWMNGCPDLHYSSATKPKHIISILQDGMTDNQDNRCKGIELEGNDDAYNNVKFPLKLVSTKFQGTYEDCPGVSHWDPNQGFSAYTWDHSDYRKIYAEIATKPAPVMRKFKIEKLAIPVDGYTHNAQVWISVDWGKTFAYCGIGKFCHSAAECKQFFKDYINEHK